MKVILLRDYRGKMSGEKFYPAGVYDEATLGVGLVSYLLEQGWATVEDDKARVASETKRGGGDKVHRGGNNA